MIIVIKKHNGTILFFFGGIYFTWIIRLLLWYFKLSIVYELYLACLLFCLMHLCICCINCNVFNFVAATFLSAKKKQKINKQTANSIPCFSLASCKKIYLQIFILSQICLKFKIWSFLCLLLYQSLIVQLSSFNKSKIPPVPAKGWYDRESRNKKKYMLSLQRGLEISHF